MELARKELGEDALLVNARPATPETRHLGAYEVVFGVASTAAGRDQSRSAPGRPSGQRLTQRSGGVDWRERAGAAQARTWTAPAHAALDSAPGRCTPAWSRMSWSDARAGHRTGRLDELFEVDATLGRPGAERAIVALVGPPGVGKTTTLVKLAARFGLTSRKPAQIFRPTCSGSPPRISLRSLASILGIGCDVVETPGALAQVLEEHRAKDLVFIDTPGLSPRRNGRRRRSGAADRVPSGDRHAPGPAGVDEARRHGPGDRSLRDFPAEETPVHAPRRNRAVRRPGQRGRAAGRCRFRSSASGQQIPDDLEPADQGTP